MVQLQGACSFHSVNSVQRINQHEYCAYFACEDILWFSYWFKSQINLILPNSHHAAAAGCKILLNSRIFENRAAWRARDAKANYFGVHLWRVPYHWSVITDYEIAISHGNNSRLLAATFNINCGFQLIVALLILIRLRIIFSNTHTLAGGFIPNIQIIYWIFLQKIA